MIPASRVSESLVALLGVAGPHVRNGLIFS